jgi:hypothetical protein
MSTAAHPAGIQRLYRPLPRSHGEQVALRRLSRESYTRERTDVFWGCWRITRSSERRGRVTLEITGQISIVPNYGGNAKTDLLPRRLARSLTKRGLRRQRELQLNTSASGRSKSTRQPNMWNLYLMATLKLEFQ